MTTWIGISMLSSTCPRATWTHCTSDASFMLPSPVGQMVSTRINCRLIVLMGLEVSLTTIFPAVCVHVCVYVCLCVCIPLQPPL